MIALIILPMALVSISHILYVSPSKSCYIQRIFHKKNIHMTMIWIVALWEFDGKSASILLRKPKQNSYEYRQIRIFGLDGSHHETF